jgi:hypothetical protein
MGKQYNKSEKRGRRVRYLKRKKSPAKSPARAKTELKPAAAQS